MKKFGMVAVAVFVVCLLVLAGCGKNAAEPFIGFWDGYKVVSGSTEIKFSDFAGIAKMELTAQFTSDGEYELHYYVNGKEGDKYPQYGSYEMDGEKIILIDHDGYGKIVDGELVLYFSNGQVKQYFKSGK